MMLCDKCPDRRACAARSSCHIQWVEAHPPMIEPTHAQIYAAYDSMNYDFANSYDDGYEHRLRSIPAEDEITEIRNMLRAALNA